jgi:hypothetical protein
LDKGKVSVSYALLQYLRTIRLNVRKIAVEWHDCRTASTRRDAALNKLQRFIKRQLDHDPQMPVILSSKASAARRDAEIWGDRADASASAILLLADRFIRRLHRATTTGDVLEWPVGEIIAGVRTSQAIIAASNAIRHADEWAEMILSNGEYNESHRNFKRARKSFLILQALLQEQEPICEPRSADIVTALSTDGQVSSDVLLRRLTSIAAATPLELEALQDEIQAEEESMKADFDFVR